MSIATALDAHLTNCSKCGGTYPIIATGTRTHNGFKAALIGDKTACSATIIGA
ncbi:conserved hypothetical protein [Burkholderia sp. 8Y]|nr:conserved hypothetical protein [Burkholderia sp. 8Y]